MFLPTDALPTLIRTHLKAPVDGWILGLDWPANGGRARRIVYRARDLVTGLYPSWKMDRMIEWESINERNACVLLDACHSVKAFAEQPVVIRYVLNGVEHEHYPDMLVEMQDGKELWEVKPRNRALDDFILDRTRLMAAELPRHGYRYRVVLAEDLKEKPRLRIARQLLKWGRRPPDLLVRERVRVAMAKQPFVTWGMAIDGAFGPAGIRALSRLTLQGTLGCDADDCIDRFTRFFPRAAEGRC